jgi:dTDP-4-dehydrorhamnose 3,5-epimerase
VKVIEEPFGGVKLIEMDRFEDDRGWFSEMWNEKRSGDVGLGHVRFVQTNVSSSRRGVLRGLHYQTPPHGQGKLVSVVKGSVFDVVVDIRRDSRSFGRWYGCELSRENRRQLWVSEGFAHGFLVLSHDALVIYGCSTPYCSKADRSLAWNDPAIAIEWPTRPLIISNKDATAPGLSAIAEHPRPSSR